MEPTADIPILLRGDLLNWLRPECVLRPPLSAIRRRAQVALQALEMGRVELREAFLKDVLEELARRPDHDGVDALVTLLKGAARAGAPWWPYVTSAQHAVQLPRRGQGRVVDAATVPGGALAVLLADSTPERPTEGGLTLRWRLAWIDLASFEVDHIRTFVHPASEAGPVKLVPGFDDDAPLAILYGFVLIHFDTAGRSRLTDVPFLRQRDRHRRVTAAALDPSTGDLICALLEDDATQVVRIARSGVASLVRFPGQIDRFALGPDIIVGIGLRDVVTVDPLSGRTALRDVYPYFADQPHSCGTSAVISGSDRVLVHEGGKVLQVSRDLRLIETEYILPDPADRILPWDDRLLRVNFSARVPAIELLVDTPAASPP